ncbi:uncharacterized protein JCM15063_004435 [Sporobolomyces koalae]|uniref:uncharacterized protein n=1 Tax=Sporobolomyces koalae TaxID=500713 RepID=UPI00317B3F35
MSASNARPAKRKRTRTPPPQASKDASRLADHNDNNNNNNNTTTTAIASPGTSDRHQDLDDDERWRIYEMLSEEYHDILTELPLDYHRTFMLMQELEQEQQEHTLSLKSNLKEYLVQLDSSTSGTMADRDQPARVRQIESTFDLAHRALEDKVNLALTLYESVDRHIQRLDTDLAMYEDRLVIGLRTGTLPSNEAPSKGHVVLESTTNGAGAGPSNGTGKSTSAAGGTGNLEREKANEWNRMQQVVRKQQRDRKRKTANQDQPPSSPSQAPLVGMPIDPNEPTYCYCNRVAFGEMIGCENQDCPREWFHLECVGMDRAPVGEWWCRDCRGRNETD